MSISKIAAAILIAGGMSAYGANAFANEPATSLNCLKMAKEVKDALNVHPVGSAHDAAKQQLDKGTTYCMKGYYKAGMERYEAALKAIGSKATASAR